MNDLQKNYEHWRRIFIRINITIAVLITIVEILMSFALHFQGLILQETLLEYIIEYIVLPNAIIWGGLLITGIVFAVVNNYKEQLLSRRSSVWDCGSMYDGILNVSLILMMTLSMGTVAYVHYIFRVTVAGLCIPIFLSIVFYSRKICIHTIVASELMIMAVAAHRYARQTGEDPYIMEDVIIIMVFILVIGMIALNVIKHMKEQYDRMVEAREVAEIANQAKSTFLANMSHDIRTPINAVMGMDEMILRKSQDQEVLSYASDIKKASHALLSIINDILDVSKIESGKLELLPVEYDLSELVHDVYNNVVIKARDKDLTLRLDVDESLPNRLIGDDIRIRQIITNLLSNGVKYTNKGSVTLQIVGKSVESGVLLSVLVRDTGIGIKEEDMPKLKEKFQRLDERKNRHIQGTGLGISIVVGLLELMGSSLLVESQYGIGSCFSFTILQEVANSEPIGKLEKRFNAISRITWHDMMSSWIAPKAKLLVVDDNHMNLKVFDQLLKQYMMRIDQVESGEECLEKITQVQYDIIFLDDMMPGLDGMETLKLMQEMDGNQCVNTPVIALTANAVKGAMEGYLNAGFDGYLAKPIVPEKLEKMILDMLPPEVVQYDMVEGDYDDPDYEDDAAALEPVNSQVPDITFTFPEIPGINWQYGMSVWCNPDILLELAMDFYHELEEELVRLNDWESRIEEEEAMSSFCIRVHSIKGTAATIGALNLSAMALILEKAAKAKDALKIHLLWPDLKTMMEEYLDNMKVLEENHG